MGFWTKREETHFQRDKYGNVINMSRRTDPQLNAERIDSRRNGPSLFQNVKHEYKERMQDRAELRAIEQQEYKKARYEARLNLARERGKRAGSLPSHARLTNFVLGPSKPMRMQSSRPMVQHIHYHGKTKSKKSKKKPRRPGYGFSGMGLNIDPVDNWGLWK
jgi:hypothetical protein